MVILFIGLGGALGALGRSSLLFLMTRLFDHPFLSSTLSVNVIGCFLAGLLFPLLKEAPPFLSSGVMVGFLGGFTTFSSFSLEVLSSLEKGEYFSALVYALLSLTLSLSACFFGYSLASS